MVGGGAKCITASGKLNECNVSKHIMPQQLEQSVDGRRGERGGGSREFLFYFAKVCALCLSARC